jgi:hypothetical protein
MLNDTRLYNLMGADLFGRPKLRWEDNIEIQLKTRVRLNVGTYSGILQLL